MSAQGDCTDGIHTYKVINSYMTVTNAISQGLLLPAEQAQTTSQFVILNSELAINTDYNFANGSDIIGGKNGKIFITGSRHLNFIGSKLHGCNTLMRGIYMEGGGIITFKNSEVRNVFRVFYMAGGSGQDITLENNLFENNEYIVETDNVNNVTTNIYGNIFTGGNIAPPYGYNTPSIAFKLKNIDNFIIGDISKAKNYFKFYNGKNDRALIKVDFENYSSTNGANIEINNSDFNELNDSEILMNSDISRTDEIYIKNCEFKKTAIKAEKLNNLTINGCDFRNHTITTPYSFNYGNLVNVTHNKFYGTISDPPATSFSVSNSKYVEISNNTLYDIDGFEINNCLGLNGFISHNTMTNTILGLWFNNNICSSDFEISFNNINSFNTALFTQLSENFVLKNNTVSNYIALPDIGQQMITSIYNENYSILGNKITGEAESTNGLSDFGIFNNKSPFGINECNVINDVPKGIDIVKDNKPLDLIANKLKNTIVSGILIGDFNLTGYLGNQFKNGNRWMDGNPNYLELNDPSGAIWTITNSNYLGPDYIPNPYAGNVILVNSSNFSERENPFYCDPPVVLNDPRKVTIGDFDNYWNNAMVGIYNGKNCYDDANNCGGALFDVQFNILTALFHNPELLLQVPNTTQFWSEKMNEPIGALFIVDKNLESINNANDLELLLNQLNNITTYNIFEENFKKALKYRINSFKTGSDWTNDEIIDLESIAEQCPETGGKGVDIARSLLNKDFKDYNDTELCSRVEPRNAENSEKFVSFSPNPASDYLYVNIGQEFEYGQLFIYNNLGQLIKKIQLDKNEQFKRIYCEFGNGIYYINTILDNNKRSVEKLEILK
jgi:hypothetical protein